jgi:hypothetical protein
MRSDLIAANMIRHWLLNNAPQLLDGWAFQGGPELDGFVAKIKTIDPDIDAQFASQGAIARTAIELWNLKDVAVLGGGSPTPLSPLPEQVRYFTDVSVEAVAESAAAGYTTECVDVKNVDDLKKLTGASTAVSTGLFHFLPVEAATQVFENLAQAGFNALAFNCMDISVGEDLLSNWSKLGYILYPRTMDDVRGFLPPGWHLDQALNAPDFFKNHHVIWEKFLELKNMQNMYLAVRD